MRTPPPKLLILIIASYVFGNCEKFFHIEKNFLLLGYSKLFEQMGGLLEGIVVLKHFKLVSTRAYNFFFFKSTFAR